MYKLVPTDVRRRVEFILHLKARGSTTVMERQTGVARGNLTNALDPDRQNFSKESAVAFKNTYGVSTDFMLTGDRTLLPHDVGQEVDRWIAKGWWDVETGAPRADVADLLRETKE